MANHTNHSGLKRGGSKGRPKGTPNKLTTAAKSAIEAAALGLGGAKRLQAWAAADCRNEDAFWTLIYPKLLPLQVTGGEGQPLVPRTVTFLITQQPGAENQT